MSFFGGSNQYRTEKFQKIIDNSITREDKIKNSKILKEKLEIERSKKIYDYMNRKSKEYKEAIKRIRAENIEFNKKLKRFFVVFNMELIVKIIVSIAVDGS